MVSAMSSRDFTRIATKILPIGKELASKAIGAIHNRAGKVIGNKIVDTFNAAKETLMLLVQGKKTR